MGAALEFVERVSTEDAAGIPIVFCQISIRNNYHCLLWLITGWLASAVHGERDTRCVGEHDVDARLVRYGFWISTVMWNEWAKMAVVDGMKSKENILQWKLRF